MPIEVRCICGDKASCNDLYGEPLCRTCCDRFNSRAHPRAMTHKERVNEVAFIVAHFDAYKIKNKDKYRRLSELSGKDIKGAPDTTGLVSEMLEQEDEDLEEWEYWLEDADGYRSRGWSRPNKHLQLLDSDGKDEAVNTQSNNSDDDDDSYGFIPGTFGY